MVRNIQTVDTRYDLLHLLPPGPIVGVEVGVDCGINARELLLSRDDVFLWTVDPWGSCPGYEEGVAPGRKVAMREYGERVGEFTRAGRCQHLRLSSVEAARHLSGRLTHEGVTRCLSVNFVYIDALHTAEAVTEDIEAWWPLLLSGGMLAGHDFEEPGVHTPVIKFAHDHGLELQIINERGDPRVALPPEWKGPRWKPGHVLDRHGGWVHPSFVIWKP